MTDREILTRLAVFGPFFELQAHSAATALSDGWRPLDELLRQPEVLASRVAAVRAALAALAGPAPAQQPGELELRVAASMAQLGLAARLICPAIGVAVLTGRLLKVDPGRMRWRPGSAAGPVELSISADALPPRIGAATAGRHQSAAAQLAEALAGTVLASPVRELVEASMAFGVSPQVLWGNVASVVNGAKTLIGAAEPGLSETADTIVTGLLSQPPLSGTWQGSPAPVFRRRSCCLVYRLAPAQAPVCGDCVLDRAPAPASGARNRAR